MSKCLIILNQQPFIPPFMLSAITCAKDRYDKVYYVNTKNPDNKSLFADCANVQFNFPSVLDTLIALLLAIPSLFSSVVCRDIKRCIKDKGFSFHIIKLFLIEQTVHYRLLPIAKKIVKQEQTTSEITVLSTWFDACAFTAATIKKLFPSLRAFSLAHSYEILLIRNPYVPYRHINYKHQYLDGVFFISHIIREMYFSGVGQLPQAFVKKTHVCYLGSYKDQNVLNQVDAEVFNICTCSRMIPLKRLDLLLETMKDWTLGRVRWIHMGDGPLFDSLWKRAQSINESNPLVEIVFTGKVSNSKVKEHYATCPVDVFVNLSEIEGLPISIMEAISYGIPVIATDVGGTREIVTKDVGILLDQNANNVQEALALFYNMSPDDRQSLRNSAYMFWLDNYDAAKNLPHLFDLIQTV